MRNAVSACACGRRRRRRGGGHPEQREDRDDGAHDGGADEPCRERVGCAGRGGERAGACWRPRTGWRHRARHRPRGRSSGTRTRRRRARPGCRPWRSPRRGRTPCRRRARARTGPGRMSVARCAPASAVESHSEAATVMSSPTVAMTRGERWLSRWRGDQGAGGDGERERQEREPGLQGGVAEDGLQEDRGQEDGADQDAGDAEHHRGAGDQGLELPDVRREQRLGRALLEREERRPAGPRRAASAVTVWTDHQPWVSVPETP